MADGAPRLRTAGRPVGPRAAALVPAVARGHEAETVKAGGGFSAKVGGTFAFAGRLADRVRSAVEAGLFPWFCPATVCRPPPARWPGWEPASGWRGSTRAATSTPPRRPRAD